jgi:hypothetical protein
MENLARGKTVRGFFVLGERRRATGIYFPAGGRRTDSRIMTSTQPHARQAVPPAGLSRKWRWVISLLLIFHLAAVFTAPFTFATSSGPGTASPFAATMMGLLQPYIDAAFLNHGYFFFAPNPGPAHLVRYRLEFDDGREPVERMFPDLKRHWPRLLYHRHFMLAESYNGRFAPPAPPPEVATDPVRRRGWQRSRRQYELLRDAYAEHLRARYGADRVTLTRVEHRLPMPPDVLDRGMQLDDPRLYIDMSEEGAPPGGGPPLPMGPRMPGGPRLPGGPMELPR